MKRLTAGLFALIACLLLYRNLGVWIERRHYPSFTLLIAAKWTVGEHWVMGTGCCPINGGLCNDHQWVGSIYYLGIVGIGWRKPQKPDGCFFN